MSGRAGQFPNPEFEPHRCADRVRRYENGCVQMKTFMAKPGEVEQRWWLVDASGCRVGRLATEIAMVLMGKHRPTYTPHVDTGDHVVVINAEQVEFGGKKWQQKLYRWYTGYQGLKTETAQHRLDRRPELILEEAVRRMLPKNRLGRVMLDKLKVYAGSEHPHQAQRPEPMAIKAIKNTVV
jgi:large subunit ribosomal protein L13